MEGKAKFKIEYTWNNKDFFEKAKNDLLSEGWERITETLPCYPERVKDNEKFVCWFERKWLF